MSTLITSGLKSSITRSVITTNPLLEQSGIRSRYVKVLKVVLNEGDIDSSLWAALGFSQALYGVFYQNLYENNTDREETVGNFAYCGNANIRRIPVPGEIVLVDSLIRADRSQDVPMIQESTFWIDVVPAWNSPEVNYFIISGSDQEVEEPETTTNPLQLNPGDFTIEGRHGQSIRFGGGYRKGGLGAEENNNSPYILVRNGQGVKVDEGDVPVYENINSDSSSIYLTTTQIVKLTEANDKTVAWKSDAPVLTSNFTGSQVILNSDRIIANARSNDIKFLAKQGIALSGQRVGVDGKDFVSLDADKVYLGQEGQFESEPVLKGKTTTEWLSYLCSILDNFLRCFSETERDELAAIAGVATALRDDLQNLASEGRLKELHSNKVFTE